MSKITVELWKKMNVEYHYSTYTRGKRMKNYKYIIFDLDGTITDPRVGITKSIDYALRYFGIETENLDSLCKYIGPPLLNAFQEDYGFDEDKARLAISKYREYFNVTGIYENVVYTGVEEMLKNLQNKHKKLMMATSKPTEFAIRILEHFNLIHYFDFVAGSEMDGRRSEKADVIKYVIEENHVSDCSEIIMIGDRKYDIIGAKKTGIDSVGVLYGYGDKEELIQAGADYIIEKVEFISDLF